MFGIPGQMETTFSHWVRTTGICSVFGKGGRGRREANDPSAREKKLIAYEIAGDAKEQIVIRAMRITAASDALAATLSIQTWINKVP